jgi:predicted NAD-dependent protein-ADP-ribosyltransferase YbiA (DUF1768 family)
MSVGNTNYLIPNPALNGAAIQNNSPNELGAQTALTHQVASAATHQAESTISCCLATRTEIISPNEDFICFTETPTSEFANAYPCTFEFGGKFYLNATACFLAQQYTDQPLTMDLFTQCETAEEAHFLAEQCPVTPGRKLSWNDPDAQHINKNDVMMHVLRAKFGQNPELKEKLLSTGNLYIACQGFDLCWSDCFNGSGQNLLGLCLMQLRGEYGGVGITSNCPLYGIKILDVSTRCFAIMDDLPRDIIWHIYGQCFSNNDITSIQALACTNMRSYKCITSIVEKIDLKELCPLLKIVSAEEAQKYGFNAVPAPSFPKLSLIKGYQDMAPNVEGDAGVTYFDFILPEDLTLRQVIEIAKAQGITVETYWDQILIDIGDVAIKQVFPCMLANNVFKDSRNKRYDVQCVLVRRHGCELPTVEQYIIHIVLISKIYNQCLFGENPLTYGRSSTFVEGFPLVVGGSAPGCLDVSRRGCGPGNVGAGSRRKF